MARFHADLRKMHNGSLAAPYESVTIETGSAPDAIEKAKQWALTIRDKQDAWLHIHCEGRTVARLEPGAY